MRVSLHHPASMLSVLTGVALLASAGAVSGRDDGDAKASLKGYMEVPAISSTATGRFRARIDEKAQTIHYELSYSGLESDVRQAHIHLGQKSVNGGIMVFLCQTTFNKDPTGLAPTCPQEGSVSGTLQAQNLTALATAQGIDPTEQTAFDEMVAAIRAGVAYANVHTANHTGGEIRGQLLEDD